MAEINNIEDISTNFEKITNLINSMRAQGVLSFSGVDKVLTAINSKLDDININENADLVKLMLNELKSNIDERHGYVVTKFAEIENAVNSLLQNHEDVLQASEIKSLFDVIATNLAVFSKEVVSQKDTLTEITLRLESLRTDNTNKDEIIDTISALKTDISRVNNGFESIIVNINNNFKELSISFEKLAESNLGDKFTSSLDDIQSTSNTILSAIQMIDKKNSELNEGLGRLITIGDFNEAKELLLHLSTKQDDMQSIIANTADRSTLNNLSGIVNSSINAINELKLALINNSDDKSLAIINKLEYLDGVVKQASDKFDFDQFKRELLNILNDIGKETNVVCGDLLETNNDLKRILTAVNLADFNEKLSQINQSIANNETKIKDVIEGVTEKVTSETRDAINAIIESLKFQIGEINSRFDIFKDEFASIDGENSEQVIESISAFSEIANTINSKLDAGSSSALEAFNLAISNVKTEIESISSKLSQSSKESVSEIISKLDGLFSITADLKTELMLIAENNVQKVSSNIQTLSEVITNLNNHISEIPLEFPEKVEQRLTELYTQLKEFASGIEASNNKYSETVITDVSNIYSALNSLSDEFKSLYSSDSDNLRNIVSNLYERINELNTELPSILFQTSGQMSDFVATLQEKLEGTNKYIAELTEKVDNNDSQNITVDKIEAVNSDIKFVLNNLNTLVTENNNVLVQKIAEIDSDVKVLSGSIFENLGSAQADINNKINNLSDVLSSIKDDINALNESGDDNSAVYDRLNDVLRIINDAKDTIIERLNSNDASLLLQNKLEIISNNIRNSIEENNTSNRNSIIEQVQAIVSDIKNIIYENSNTHSESHSLLSEKLDSITNNSYANKDSILSGINELKQGLEEHINTTSSNINENVSGIADSVQLQSGIVTNKLEEVSKDVKNVTDKLANYFINNDSDLVTKLNEVSDKISSTSGFTSDKIDNVAYKSDEISTKIQEIEENLTNKAEVINSNLISHSGILSDKLENLSSEVKNVTGDIVNHFIKDNEQSSTNAENINKNIDYTRNEIINNVQESANKLSVQVDSVKTGIDSLSEQIEVAKQVQQTSEVLANKLDTITADVKGITTELINQISQDDDEKDAKFDMIGNNVNFAKQEISEQIAGEHAFLDANLGTISAKISDLKDDLLSKSDNTLLQYNRLIETLDDSKSEIINITNTNHQDIKDTVLSTLNSNNSETDNRLIDLCEKVAAIKDELLSSIKSIPLNENIESLKYNIDLITNKIGESQNTLDNATAVRIQSVHNNINNVKEVFEERLKNSSENIINSVSSVIDTLAAKQAEDSIDTDEIIECVKNSLASFQSSIEFSNTSLMETAKNDSIAVISLVNSLKTALETLESSIKDRVDNNQSEIVNSIQTITSQLNDLFNEYNSSIVDAIQELSGNVSSIPQKIENSEQIIVQKIDDAKCAYEEQLVNILNKVNDFKITFSDSSDDFNNNINTRLEVLKDNLKEFINSKNSESDIKIEDIALNIKNLAQILTDYSENIQNKSSENIQIITSNLEELRNNIGDLASNSADSSSIIEFNKEKLQIISESINNLFDTISVSDQGLAEKLENGLIQIDSAIRIINTGAQTNKSDICDLINNRIGLVENILSKIQAKQETQKAEIYEQIIESVENIKNITEDSDLRISESVNSIQEMKNVTVNLLTDSQNILNQKLLELNEISNNHYNNVLGSLEKLKSTLVSNTDFEDKFTDIEGSLINISRDLDMVSNKTLSLEDIDVLRTDLLNIKSDIIDFVKSNSKDKSEKIMSDLSDKLLDNNSVINNMVEQVETIRTIIAPDDSVDNISSKINSLIVRFDEIDNNLDGLSAIINENHTVQVSNIDAIGNRLENSILEIQSIVPSKEQHNCIIEQLKSIKAEFEIIDNNMKKEINENILSITSFNDNIRLKLDTLEASVHQTIASNIETIVSSIDNVSNSIKVLDENLDEDTTRQLTIIQDELTTLSGSMFTNTEKLTNNSLENFTAIKEKFDYISDLINSIQVENTQKVASNLETIKTEFSKLHNLFDKNEELQSELVELSSDIKNYYNSIVSKIEENSSIEQVELCINKIEAVENKIDKIDFTSRNAEEADKLIISNMRIIEQKLETVSSNVDTLSQNTLQEELEDIKSVLSKQHEQFETISKIEDIDKLPHIEEISLIVKDNTVNLLEEFNSKIDKVSNKEVIADELNKLKSEILAQTVKILDQISFEVEQDAILDCVQENTNTIKAVINCVKDDLMSRMNVHSEELLNTLSHKDDIASEFDYVNKKLDDIADDYEMQKGFENITAKLDSVVDDTLERGFEEVKSKLDLVVDDTLERGFEEVKSKLDSVVYGPLGRGFEEVKSQLETVANNDELQKEFEEVKKHLLTIQSGDSKADYNYSLQDVESDIAKLRIAMKELQDITPDEELEDINNKIDSIVMVVDSIKNEISQAEIDEIGIAVNKMNDDIVSISSRTNKLILTADASSNMLKDYLKDFKDVINDLDERTRVLAESYDLSDVHESIATIQQTLVENTNHNNIVNQSLLAIAEWVDCAGETLTSISNKIEKIDDIEDVKAMIRSIEMPSQFNYSVFDTLEEKLNSQQDKIDMLEEKLNRLTELVEANDNSQINKKISSVDRQLTKLNKSIERLTSYVDEE